VLKDWDMPKEQKTARELARLVQSETVRRGLSCDVMIERDRNVGWTGTALTSPSRAAELQGYLDAISNDLRETYDLKQP
jgi:hypothetical protein